MGNSQHPVFNISAGGRTLEFFFNDKAVEAFEGQSVSAALARSGVWSLSKSRAKRQPRGMFCGQGWCANCYVAREDGTRVLACKLEARDGMRIYSVNDAPALPEDRDD